MVYVRIEALGAASQAVRSIERRSTVSLFIAPASLACEYSGLEAASSRWTSAVGKWCVASERDMVESEASMLSVLEDRIKKGGGFTPRPRRRPYGKLRRP